MEEQSKGLWDHLEKPRLYNTKFTIDTIKSVFSDIFKTPKPERKIIVYTNVAGMFLFDLAARFGNYFPDGIRYWVETYKKVNMMAQISLFEKHGLYKIKVFSEHTHGEFRFYFYYGTKLLFISNTAEDYKLLNYKGNQTPYHIKRKNEL
jgi:hypothetical protein